MSEKSVPEKAVSGLVMAGGVLAIIAAAFAAISGFLAVANSISYLSQPYLYDIRSGLSSYQTVLLVGFFNLLGFAFGLAAGIQSLMRKQFAFVVIGILMLISAGALNFIAISGPYGTGGFWDFGIGVFWALTFGVPIVILSLTGLVFVAIKQREFT